MLGGMGRHVKGRGEGWGIVPGGLRKTCIWRGEEGRREVCTITQQKKKGLYIMVVVQCIKRAMGRWAQGWLYCIMRNGNRYFCAGRIFGGKCQSYGCKDDLQIMFWFFS